ncbi:efflux RND transporter permease subunit [Nocardia sp. CDC159]|uniref:Efflux RND transporter permease subunit n=1 Tax=Nocardia pulmonis TaxID=2951408 RepID=A0A9X2EE59_9NOCA|nr:MULTISPECIES: efflux RND transporter permease subunit [Nocardia]MCM6778716.1 efflux RND transporter permease subunit [Nocardia pulmonis]MCM6791605.1 efflux RND transporter permease subunit [Nocardia sp. CDC159]
MRWPEVVAGFAARRKWLLIVVWVALLGAGALGAGAVGDRLSNGSGPPAAADSVRTDALLARGFEGRGPTSAVLIVHDRRNEAGSAEFDDRARAVFDAVASDPRLEVTSSFGWSTQAPGDRDGFLGKDHRTVVTSIGLGLDDAAATTTLPAIQKDLENRFAGAGLDVSLVSIQAFQGELTEQSATGLAKAELLALPLIVIVLLLLFRSVAATAVALVTTMAGIVLALGLLDLLAQVMQLNIFAKNIIVMLGLGVGVDYALVMLKRFKSELAQGRDVSAAVTRTVATAGHTVIASALTIVVAVAALFIVPLSTVVSLAIGAVLAVVLAMLVALLLLPALMHLLGRRIDAGRIRLPESWLHRESDAESSRWHRITLRVMNRPATFLTIGIVILLLLAIPTVSMKLFTPDARILSAASPVTRGADLVAEQFGPGVATPIVVVFDSDARAPDAAAFAELERFVADVGGLPDVAAVGSALPALRAIAPSDPRAALEPAVLDRIPPDARAGVHRYVARDGRTFVVEVVSAHRSSDDATTRLLDRVRDRAAAVQSMTTAVGGETARGDDSNREIARTLPWVFGLMLVAVYLVLLGTFRSVFLPLKAIVANVLTAGATFGVMVVIFQFGWLPEWLGLGHAGALFFIDPLVVLALIVGLSTDYEVFLLSRVREEYLSGGDNRLAVARGMSRTAPMITGAALLMIVVFGAFGFAGIMPIQQLGIGLAVAVAIDATVVRVVLVPAAMQLMGRWNWWNPLARTGPPRSGPPEPAVVGTGVRGADR